MEQQDIVKLEQENQLSIGNQQVSTNIPSATKAEKLRLFNISSRCTARLNDIVGQVIEVNQYYITKFVRKDKETNAPRTALRTILVTKDDKSYVTMSSYFGLQFIRLLQTFGKEIEDGIKLRIIKITKEGKQGEILQFEIVTDDSQETPTGE